jgi:hypothetical protein
LPFLVWHNGLNNGPNYGSLKLVPILKENNVPTVLAARSQPDQAFPKLTHPWLNFYLTQQRNDAGLPAGLFIDDLKKPTKTQ